MSSTWRALGLSIGLATLAAVASGLPASADVSQNPVTPDHDRPSVTVASTTTKRLLPALTIRNSLTAKGSSGPHAIFSPQRPRDVNGRFKNRGRTGLKLSIKTRSALGGTASFRLAPGEDRLIQVDDVTRVTVTCDAGDLCQTEYQLTYAPRSGGLEPADPSFWIAGNTCHGHSTNTLGPGCVQGMDGLICPEAIQPGTNSILPATSIGEFGVLAHSPHLIAVQYCANTFCDDVTLDGGEIEVQVQRADPSPDVGPVLLNLDEPIFVQTLSNVQSVQVTCRENSFDVCRLRWQICHVPGPWLTLDSQ